MTRQTLLAVAAGVWLALDFVFGLPIALVLTPLVTLFGFLQSERYLAWRRLRVQRKALAFIARVDAAEPDGARVPPAGPFRQ